ncbi:MAG: NAD kinase [Bacteroidetes bacterium MedPE-SWsnd-G2]|nr:MAG: NAD kinase [Bacteroidetes bacterium MedPE-SWsnd-G2]
MKIAIYGQYYTERSQTSIDVLINELKNNNATLIIKDAYLDLLIEANAINFKYKNLPTYSNLDESFDLLISIGGDGTILRAITDVLKLNIPIVGINTGRLGFLATIQENEIEDAVKAILKGEYKISERTVLSVETTSNTQPLGKLNFALNEIAVSRKNTTSMITVDTHLNDEYLTSYWADGLIISTPTGSTGYSLSCGGPVITPGSNSLVLTPIAPHNLNARPLVIPSDTKIQLKVNGREPQYLMSMDSRLVTLNNNDEVIIKEADFNIKMVELLDESFIDTLRKKLLWGEDNRN